MSKPTHCNEENVLDINLQLFSDGEDDESDNIPLDDETDNETDETENTEETDEQDNDEPEEEFDEITYNKEVVKIPKKERQTYLQKGYNYDKVNTKLSETETELKEIESLTGMNRKEVIAYLKNQQIEEKVSSYAEQTGMSEEDARREVEKDLRLQAVENELHQTKQQTQIQSQKAIYKDKPFFNELEGEIDELVKTVQNVDIPTAYKYILGNYVESGKLDELSNKVKKQAEQRTIANMQDRARRGTVVSGSDAGSGDDVDVGSILGREDIEMAEAFGNSPKNIAKYVKSKLKK